jgi:hypothetical protein
MLLLTEGGVTASRRVGQLAFMQTPLELMIRRERRRLTILPIVIAVVGVPFLFVGLHQFHGDAWQPIAIGIVLFAVAARFLRGARRYGNRLAQPENVVWIYEHTLKKNGTDHHSVCFGYTDGTLEGFGVTAPLVKQPALRVAIDAAFPAARRGYSTELAAAFQRDPRAVLS